MEILPFKKVDAIVDQVLFLLGIVCEEITSLMVSSHWRSSLFLFKIPYRGW